MKLHTAWVWAVSLSALGAVAVAAERPASPVKEKIAGFVAKKLAAEGSANVLVKMKGEPDFSSANKAATKEEKGAAVYQELTRLAQSTQASLVAALSQKGATFRQFYITNMVLVENADAQLVQEIAARPDVEKVYGNPVVAMQKPVPVQSEAMSFFGPQTFGASKVEDNIVSTGATKVWQEFKTTGEGIVVAGQDTGVQWDHPALKPHYRGLGANGQVDHNYNWHDSIKKALPGQSASNTCGYDTQAPCDDDQHGTHTMGTVVGNDGGENAIGMAPGAKWIACRNMDTGLGAPSTYIDCFEWLLAPYALNGNPMKDGDPRKAPDVINNSWGCPPEEGCTGDEILPALKALSAAGVMVVVSAGNDGPGCGTINDPPAYHTDFSFSVGALDHRNGEIAYFSSRGPSKIDGGQGPDITAPGVSIRSSVPGSSYQGGFWSGTSMAGPHAAGAVALLWAARPQLRGKVAETAELLRKAATPKTTTESCGGVPGSAIPNNTYGFGALDIYKAVKLAQ